MENKIKNSEEYLHSKIGKKNNFSIPKDYFNTVEDLIDLKRTEENLSKESGFNIPDTYFKGLEDTILNKVTEKETKVISFKSKIIKIIPFAAAASILLFIGFNSFNFNKTETLTLDSLSDNDIEYWLDNTLLKTNDIELILQEDILLEDDFSLTTLKDETIENYINDNSDDYTIFEELNN